MKKIYFLIGVLLITLTATAQTLTIPKFEDGANPIIDGVVDELWYGIDENFIELEYESNQGWMPSINEGWFKMGWNTDTLFMIMFRDDDDLARQWETNLPDWQSDRDEIFIDVHVDTLNDGRGASDDQNGASYGHYQFTSLWPEATEWIGWPNQWYHNAPYKLGYVITDDSYYTEYAWPFSSLTIDTNLISGADPTFQGEEGVIFGLQIVIVDVDMADSPADENYRSYVRWVEGEDGNEIGGWERMDSAATVMLGGYGIDIIEESSVDFNVSVYPSPAIDFIMLKNVSQTVDIEIYNILGHVVLRQKNVASDAIIDISSLAKGMFIIRLNNAKIIKFIKK